LLALVVGFGIECFAVLVEQITMQRIKFYKRNASFNAGPNNSPTTTKRNGSQIMLLDRHHGNNNNCQQLQLAITT
jgi:hypothetical protein